MPSQRAILPAGIADNGNICIVYGWRYPSPIRQESAQLEHGDARRPSLSHCTEIRIPWIKSAGNMQIIADQSCFPDKLRSGEQRHEMRAVDMGNLGDGR